MEKRNIILKVEDIRKNFGDENILNGISLNLKEGEFLAIVGVSGCGKTTLLRIIAGLLEQSKGNIQNNHSIGFVFQEYSLFPWLTIKKNIMLGKRLKRNLEYSRLVDDYLKLVGLYKHRNHYPHEISGGMKQRVALLRTLLNDDKIILMDEPFRSLDLQTKEITQQVLLSLLEKKKSSIIFVTHDIEEAIFLSDRVIVLSDKPTRIQKDFAVPFSKPRTKPLKYSSSFVSLREEISKLLSIKRSDALALPPS